MPLLFASLKTPYSITPPPAHSSAHYCFPVLTFPYTGTMSLHSSKDLSPHWYLPRPSSAIHVAGAMGPSMCTHSSQRETWADVNFHNCSSVSLTASTGWFLHVGLCLELSYKVKWHFSGLELLRSTLRSNFFPEHDVPLFLGSSYICSCSQSWTQQAAHANMHVIYSMQC